ncbi:MAG: hypothetical protein P4N41_25830 [Negativicutes bacterium]|nr:hypothetical protein [Negativicutes bacterium]MDR3593096.1 hypothetical protein [Negativicutes bacterium]
MTLQKTQGGTKLQGFCTAWIFLSFKREIQMKETDIETGTIVRVWGRYEEIPVEIDGTSFKLLYLAEVRKEYVPL